jgi:hypothetical protein
MVEVREAIEREIKEGDQYFTWPDYAAIATPHQYSVIAVNGEWSAFLYRDGEFFLVMANAPFTLHARSETSVMGMMVKNETFLILRHPVAISDLSEWQACAARLWQGIICRRPQTLTA